MESTPHPKTTNGNAPHREIPKFSFNHLFNSQKKLFHPTEFSFEESTQFSRTIQLMNQWAAQNGILHPKVSQ